MDLENQEPLIVFPAEGQYQGIIEGFEGTTSKSGRYVLKIRIRIHDRPYILYQQATPLLALMLIEHVTYWIGKKLPVQIEHHEDPSKPKQILMGIQPKGKPQ